MNYLKGFVFCGILLVCFIPAIIGGFATVAIKATGRWAFGIERIT